MRKIGKVLAVAGVTLVFFLLFIFFVRLISPYEIDDIHFSIPCEEEYLAKSDVLWVIPLFNNSSIAENQERCTALRASNKTLGMHGVYHTYREFATPRDQMYLDRGIAAFEQCLGGKPNAFKAPQLALSKENAELLRNNHLKIHGALGQLTHKVYHCNDTGRFKNWMIRLV